MLRLAPTAATLLATACGAQTAALPLWDGTPTPLPYVLRVVEHSLDRTHPFTNPWRIRGSTIFRGSYDWHSCIHAHWMLLNAARLTDDHALAERTLDRLSMDRLAGEWLLLEQPANRERGYPYPRAWLYILLRELEKHPIEDPDLVQAMAEDTRDNLLRWLGDKPFPEGRPSRRRSRGLDGPTFDFRGDYHSWLFPFFCLSVHATPADEAALERLWRAKVVPNLQGAMGKQHPTDFFHLPALVSTLELMQNRRRKVPKFALEFQPWPQKLTLRNTHVIGYELSRSWPLALVASHGDPIARENLRTRLHDTIAERRVWDSHFIVTDHWVPQFWWLNHWIATGFR